MSGKRRIWTIVSVVFLGFAGLVLIAGFALPPFINGQLEGIVESRFGGKMQVKNLHISVWPLIRVSGDDVAVRWGGEPGAPPIVAVKKFSIEASLGQLLRPTKHIHEISLDGLHLQIPPHDRQPQQSSAPFKHSKWLVRFVVDEISAQNAELDLLPKNPGKPVRAFVIQGLEMHDVGLGRPASYRVTLTNPKPIGQIKAAGHFGPWNRDDPSKTSLSGKFTFDHVDLQTIKGLSGSLSSQGKFSGVLDRISVEGDTDSPDFALEISGNPIHLHTHYQATVDGTNGNTYLHPVQATFLQSEVVAQGGIYKTDDSQGRRVELDATCTRGQLQDMLRLAVKGNPPMTGNITFHTKIDIPPGKTDVAGRLKLDGDFKVQKAQFTQLNLANKLKALSRAGQGKPGQKNAGSDVADFNGRFGMGNGTIDFSQLAFQVRGAAFHFRGTYGVQNQELNFRGTLALHANLSQITTGVKSVLLKPLDLFFSKNHLTVLPIKITGTRDSPSFGLDFRHKNTTPSG